MTPKLVSHSQQTHYTNGSTLNFVRFKLHRHPLHMNLQWSQNSNQQHSGNEFVIAPIRLSCPQETVLKNCSELTHFFPIRSILAMRCIGQGLESLKTFCAVMSLPNPVEQKSHDVINNKLSRVMKEVAEESMKMAAVEEYSSSPDNL
ncbi:hypothetical protein TNCV_413151 [Trichonephila clavipes]|nr:hypothetical protein TNCV_413151 [Trichonephila clavipes]